jgi:mRNA interferase RelE/StbE
MADSRPEIPPHVAEILRRLHPDLKPRIKAAIRALTRDPGLGEPLKRELEGLWKYRVRRFRIVYAVDRSRRVFRILAIGHRQRIYEDIAKQVRR